MTKNGKQVYAHLCTWFKTKDYSGHWEMWNSDYEQMPHDPNILFENGHRDIASTNYPLTDVYDSSDPHAIEYHFLLMKLAGIDGVIVDWDGRRLNEYRHKTLMDIVPYLDMFGMKLIICFEEWAGYYPKGTFKDREAEIQAAKDELQWMFDNLGNKSFYGTINGKKPVLVFRKIHDQWFNPQEWQELTGFIHNNEGIVIFPEYYNMSFDAAVDGWFFWVGGFTEDTRHNTLEYGINGYRDFFNLCAKHQIAANPPYIFGSVVPGFDDTPVWGWGDLPRSAPRYQGKRYEESWKLSIEKDVDIVQIVTWNDWNEGSHIEPSEEFGYKYLELNKKYAAEFKGTNDAMPNDALRVPLQIFKARKTAAALANEVEKEEMNKKLDEISSDLVNGHYEAAEIKIKQIG